ncbi:vinorine synthase [Phtheirospermum japonicum]|uniref:Vinorine synthase n=1 Tax=Phtheirospermum japonicum TaxID=374723 RepID=A0A830BTG6_9LAMI|nr:vinorine synthase [Phtheirospermum japonicum]
MDVEIVSVERIKPSFPTPNHLRDFKLCLLDQLIPADYAPIVIFYPNQANSNHFKVLEKLALLKKSLSETLSRFFPLAGTIKDDLSIDCDDQGACFTTAKVKNCLLGDFLKIPDLKSIAKFLPCGMARKASDCVTNIQVSEFECGGISIGICISHRILDGAALSTFLKSWADFATMAMWGSLIKKGEFVTRRFVFDGAAIEILKDMATGLTGIRPTRVETVSGFIWKCAMVAWEERYGFRKPSLMTHLVNLRKRAVPSFSEQSIGNLTWVASAKYNVETENLGFPELVDEVRKCVSRIDGVFVKKLRDGEEGLKMMQNCLKKIEGFGCENNVDHIGFTSWCKMGFYDVDFGWGRPIWVSSIDASGPFFMNLVILIDGRFGGGMEAWVTLDEQEMAMLEQNQEFQAFASFNPSPLNVIGNGDA